MAFDRKIEGDGTRLSGFVTDEDNQPPRQCGNCIWYKHDACEHPVIQIDCEVPGEHGKPKPVRDEFCCNFFQSPGRTLLYAVRHGSDEDINLIGGWDNPDLNSKGHKDAREAAEFLKNKGIAMIYTSDLDRATQTTQIIAQALGLDKDCIVQDFRLRTWDKGYLNGAERTDKNHNILEEYKENPSWVIQDGESRNQFVDRCEEAFNYYMNEARKEGVKLIVAHNSNVKELQRMCSANTDESPDSVEPGGIARVTEKKGKVKCDVVLKDKKKS